jgi:hypothetical protein
MIPFAFDLEVLWLFGALGSGSVLPKICTTSCAESASSLQRTEANSNQTPAGVWENRTLNVDLDVKEGEWFPEDEHGPSLTVPVILIAIADAPLPLRERSSLQPWMEVIPLQVLL